MLGTIADFLNLRNKRIKPSNELIVFITGCDSGLGFRTALEANEIGFTVVAGFLQGTKCESAKKMLEMCRYSNHLYQIQLDITKDVSAREAKDFVTKLIESKRNYGLHAIINNAGVMIFGDFECQTENMADLQLSVNIAGTWRITRLFLPLLRKSASTKSFENEKPRIVIIGSHCAIQSLPVLSIYSSTKSALKAWSESLRIELKPFGIHVIYFIPGSMHRSTNLVAKQSDHFRDMKSALSDEQLVTYGDRIDVLTKVLNQISFWKSPDALKDNELMKKLMGALLEENPRPRYKHEPWRYKIYYFIFQVTPMAIRDWFIQKFMSFPTTYTCKKIQ